MYSAKRQRIKGICWINICMKFTSSPRGIYSDKHVRPEGIIWCVWRRMRNTMKIVATLWPGAHTPPARTQKKCLWAFTSNEYSTTQAVSNHQPKEKNIAIHWCLALKNTSYPEQKSQTQLGNTSVTQTAWRTDLMPFLQVLQSLRVKVVVLFVKKIFTKQDMPQETGQDMRIHQWKMHYWIGGCPWCTI